MATYLPSGTLSPQLTQNFTLPEKPETWQKILITREVHTANILNGKTNGSYSTMANLSGEQWPGPNNQALTQTMRKLVYISALPNNTTGSYAHGITTTTTGFFVSKLYGAASDSTDNLYIPLPYPSATSASIIELYMSATNVVVKTGSDRSSYSGYVVIEYGVVT